MATIWLEHCPTGARLCLSHRGSPLHKLHEVDGEPGFFVPLRSKAWQDFVAACGTEPDPGDLAIVIDDRPAPV